MDTLDKINTAYPAPPSRQATRAREVAAELERSTDEALAQMLAYFRLLASGQSASLDALITSVATESFRIGVETGANCIQPEYLTGSAN